MLLILFLYFALACGPQSRKFLLFFTNQGGEENARKRR
jgi:hypothetical protein